MFGLISGRSLLLKQLLSEAEFEECQPRSFTPDRSSTPKIDRRRSSIQKSEKRFTLTEEFEKRLTSTHKFDNRKRKLESVDSCTESLLEVSRRLDSLLSNSRKMNEDLKKVRLDLNCVEVDMARVSENCKKTKSQFRENENVDPMSQSEESEFVTNILNAAFGSDASRYCSKIVNRIFTFKCS
jgi:uncharacterized protein YabN with tetrapyrrole methylase and pyrophosphatase domain